jgi:hypothetical protein
MYLRSNRSTLFLLVMLGPVVAPRVCVADVDASASASSGGWFAKSGDEGTSSVWFGTLSWANTANINWTVPTFSADSTPLPTTPVPFSEPKFNVAGTLPTARTWTGYSIHGVGPLGSAVVSTGGGSSSVGAVFYGSNWNVQVGGLGTYNVKAVATDPFNILRSDLAGITGSTYSLYIPFSMVSGQVSKIGNGITASGYGFDVNYTTASGTTTLLDVTVNGTIVTVTPSASFGSNLRFYEEPNSTTAPTGSTTPGTLLTTAQLEALVAGDISPSGSLISPINLGVVLSGIPVPTALLPDGSVAQTSASANALETAIVPEPGPLSLLATAAAVVGCAAWLRRRVPA